MKMLSLCDLLRTRKVFYGTKYAPLWGDVGGEEEKGERVKRSVDR